MRLSSTVSTRLKACCVLLVVLASVARPVPAQVEPVELTLAGYATARPVYTRLIVEFQKEWKASTGQTVTFKESYGSSGTQTRAILSGFEADVLAQNIQSSIDLLVEKGLVAPDWDRRLPNGAVPATSVLAIVTRPGNPRQIGGWSDLARAGTEVITTNPRTSGNGRWGILAGYGTILKARGEKEADQYLYALIKNIKSLESNSRQATNTFIKRSGDALITFEHEVALPNDLLPADYPRIVPRANLQVDFPVAVIDKVVDKRGTRAAAQAFTQFLFTPKAQAVFAEFGYRPTDPAVLEKNTSQYQSVTALYKVTDFGGWNKVTAQLFQDGARFDRAQKAIARP